MSAPALLVIDVQRAFDDPAWGPRNNRAAERNVLRLLTAWRQHGSPVVHVRHRSTSPEGLFRPGTPAFEFKPEARPRADELVVEKTVNSAFIGTDLEAVLRARGLDRLVIAGFTTDHCCSSTARMAGNLGFATTIVSDATATFDRELEGQTIPAETIHRAALASLAGEVADVAATDETIAGLEDSADAR